MRRHAKASSARSSTRGGNRLGAFVRGALATRASASDSRGSGAPRGLFLALLVALALLVPPASASAASPDLSDLTVSEIGVTSFRISGVITPDGSPAKEDVFWRLEYSRVGVDHHPDGDWDWERAAEGVIEPAALEETNPITVEGIAVQRPAGVEYEARLGLFVNNNQGNSYKVTPYVYFTMDAPTTPVVTIEPVTESGIVSAHVKGTVDPEGGNVNPIGPEVFPVYWEMQYSTDGSSWKTGASGEISGAEAEATTPIPVEADLTGLSAETEYQIRLHAYATNFLTGSLNVEADSPLPNPTVTTDPISNPPLVDIDPASAITRVKAHLSGSVDPNGGNADPLVGPVPIQWELQYAPVADPEAWKPAGSGTIEGAQAESSDPIPVEADAADLHANTEYRFRLVATYAGQEETSTIATFETLSSAGPDAVTGGVVHVGPDRAYMKGEVDPNEEATSYWFEYGIEDCSAAPCTVIPANEKRGAGNGDSASPVTQVVGGLLPDTTYYYRIVAENSAGSSAGSVETFTTAPEPAQQCPNEGAREAVHATSLPNCRAWELVSPPEKLGANIMPDAGRIRAAAEERPGLPMAASFNSHGGFADVVGGGGTTFEYIAERTLEPGSSGWSTHAVTPTQEATTFDAIGKGTEPLFEAMSPDLTHGVYRAYSPLPTADDPHPNVAKVLNLYSRDDLRTAGAGAYTLLTDSVNPISPPPPPAPSANAERPLFAGASSDFDVVAFQSRYPLTADAGNSKRNPKLFKSIDGEARLVTAGSFPCPGGFEASQPCSLPGRGSSHDPSHNVTHALSADGSRLNFSSPSREFTRLDKSFDPGSTFKLFKLFQLDDGATLDPSDDAVIQVNVSEKGSPDPTQVAVYGTASTDGDRVFFASAEELTDTPLGENQAGLYLWDRQDTDETQRLGVDATGGTFTLTAYSQPTVGTGNLSAGSETLEEVKGSFAVGQTISGSGIAPGTTVQAMGAFSGPSNSTLTLSQPAEATASEVALKGAMQATTPALPFNATATEVQTALEELRFSAKFPDLPLIGKGNVEVSGGPGGSNPYDVTFTGALEGVNVMELTAASSGLAGGASTASVSTVEPVKNLTLLGSVDGDMGLLGASDDGHRVYFIGNGGGKTGIVLWSDADGPGDGYSSVAPFAEGSDAVQNLSSTSGNWGALARVTPDGKHLYFGSTSPLVGFEPGTCFGSPLGGFISHNCANAFLYSVEGSTADDPNLTCLTCSLTEPGLPMEEVGNFIDLVRDGRLLGVAMTTQHLGETRALSADGRYVFFTSRRAILEEDTNGHLDAYEYDTKTESVHLLSSGTSPQDSYFVDASSDGSDVFIHTQEALSGWDIDENYDLYDVRLNGGVPQPPRQLAECEGESCKGAAATTPPSAAAGSATLRGPGDPKPKRCPRGKRKVQRGGKTVCVKKHRKTGKHQKRNASANRRAGR